MKWALLLSMAALPHAAAAGQSRSATEVTKPDFSNVTSLEAAQKLAAEGKLVRVLAFPAELGGPDVAPNVVYITPEAAQARELVIGTLRRFASEGLIDKLDVRPEYKGKSFVPSRLIVNATSSKKGGGFNPVIEIW